LFGLWFLYGRSSRLDQKYLAADYRLVDPKDLTPQTGLSRIPEMLPMPSIKRVDVVNSERTIKMRSRCC
jgi:hypothetical protein